MAILERLKAAWARLKAKLAKYFKPGSVTWWASATPLLSGIVLLLAPHVVELQGLAAFIQTLYPSGTTPMMLINAGLAGIGIRGAFPDFTRLPEPDPGPEPDQ